MCGNKRQVLRMAMCEMYPATWQEFIEEKYFRDHKEIYTNGSEIMLVSDVKKMMQHYSQERPKGRWIKETQLLTWEEVDVGTCSVCGESWFLGEDEDCRFEEISEMWDFCPVCGADMRESEQE